MSLSGLLFGLRRKCADEEGKDPAKDRLREVHEHARRVPEAAGRRDANLRRERRMHNQRGRAMQSLAQAPLQ